MARAYSQDQRDRVIGARHVGPSCGYAVRNRVTTAVAWGRCARDGVLSAGNQGQPRRSKLYPRWDYLLSPIEAEPDITMIEMWERLREEAGCRGRVGAIGAYLDRAGVTFKNTAHACGRTS